jgi:hypothetical protein
MEEILQYAIGIFAIWLFFKFCAGVLRFLGFID